MISMIFMIFLKVILNFLDFLEMGRGDDHGWRNGVLKGHVHALLCIEIKVICPKCGMVQIRVSGDGLKYNHPDDKPITDDNISTI